MVTKSTNRLVTKSSSALQEKVKCDKLRTQLELESSERQEQIQRTFAKALQMQEKSVEEAAALKTELARTKENNEEKLQSLVEQVKSTGDISASIYNLIMPQSLFLQENLRRKNLRQELMLKSRNDEEQVQRAFAKALEMQHMAEENVTALKAELARTEHKNLEV